MPVTLCCLAYASVVGVPRLPMLSERRNAERPRPLPVGPEKGQRILIDVGQVLLMTLTDIRSILLI